MPGTSASSAVTGGFAARELPWLPSEAEYRAHWEFQQGFSYRPLHGETPYRGFVLGDDGLVEPAEAAEVDWEAGGSISGQVPPYPMKELSDFLHKYAEKGEQNLVEYTIIGNSKVDWIAAGCVLLFIVPAAVIASIREKKRLS
jgi:hypothetical protein